MQPRKLKVVFCFSPYGGNGGCSSEHPDIRNWLIPTLLKISQDDRIEPIYWIEGVDYLDLADTPVTMTRNRFVEWAREVKADVLVMIDSDNSPDVMLGLDPDAKPFFETSFDFLYKHWDKGPIMIGAPYCGPPTRPDGFGNENVYVFLWRNADSTVVTNGLRLDQYTREEAARMVGIQVAAALPTGCIMYDMRLFDHLPHPYFNYEYENEGEQCQTCHQYVPGPQTKKCSTEDVVNTRNLGLIATAKLGYDVVYCNWDAWAGHWKPRCVGKPRVVTSDQVGAHFKRALSNGDGYDQVRNIEAAKLPVHPDDAKGVQRITRSKEDCEFKGPEKQPDAFQLAHNTNDEDMALLQRIVREEARVKMLGNDKLIIVELGSWIGASAIAMADAVEATVDYEIHCVDHWKGGNKIQREAAESHDAFEQFKRNIGDRLDKTIFYDRNDTVASAADWEGQDIDVLWIDADHSRDGCRADILAWKDKVRPGGIICGHDYSSVFPGVKQAVHEVFGWDIAVEGTVWVYRTPTLGDFAYANAGKKTQGVQTEADEAAGS